MLKVKSAYTYAQMADWLDRHGLADVRARMRRQARREVKHALILFGFLKERGVRTCLGSMQPPRHRFASLNDIRIRLLLKGRRIAVGIDSLLEQVKTTNDASAAILLAWLTAVQLEEGDMIADLLKRLGPRPEGASDVPAFREPAAPALLKTRRRHRDA